MERAYALQMIYYLHISKKYRIETLFTAINIYDRYMIIKGPRALATSRILTLVVTCMLLAAKLEEPVNPSF